MKVREGIQDTGIEVNDFPEYVFRELLVTKDPEDGEGRSQVVAIRLPDGTLVLGYFPQGDTYEYVVQHWSV